MKKIIKSLLIFIFVFCIGITVNAANNPNCRVISDVNKSSIAYTNRDSILRKKYSTNYTASSIYNDGIKVSVPQGATLEILEDVGSYYKVRVLCDNYLFVNNYIGYIVKSSVSKNFVEKDSSKNRSLSVREKSLLIGNAYKILKGTKHIEFIYPKANQEDRSKGYNYILRSTYSNPKSKKCSSELCRYELDCSSFVSTIYTASFKVSNLNSNGKIFKTGSFEKDSDDGSLVYDSKHKDKYYTVNKVTKKNEVIKTSLLQTGDMILGFKRNESGHNANHIMLYIGDGLIFHSTKAKGVTGGVTVDFVDATKNNMDKAFIKVGQKYTDSVQILRIKKNYPRLKRKIVVSEDEREFNIVKLVRQ